MPHPHLASRRRVFRSGTVLPGYAVLALLLLLPGSGLRAQAPDIDVGVGAGAASCFLPGSTGRAAAADVRARWPLLRVALAGIPIASPGQDALERTAVVSALTPEWHRLRVDGTLHWASSSSCGLSSPSRIATTQLTWGAGRGGVWLGFESARQDGQFTSTSPSDTGESRATLRIGNLASAGVWRRVGAWRVSFGVRAARSTRSWNLIIPHLNSYPDSVYSDTAGWIPIIRQIASSDSVTYGARATVMDALGRISFASGRLAAEIAFGTPVRGAGFRLTGWSDVRLAYAVSPWVSVVGSASSQPVSGLSVGGGAPWRMSLGVRLASLPFSRPHEGAPAPERAAAVAFRTEREADGTVTIGLRAPQAEIVEISGDFLSWTPVRMHRDSADWWVVSAHLAPGTYHVNVRIDGARWVVPPGLPRQNDEFGGSVGVLVVR